MSTPNDHRNFIRQLLCLCILSCFLRATAFSYTTLDQKIFYVMPDWGGREFTSLDLTRSWDVIKPPVQSLPVLLLEPSVTGEGPLVVNSDKNSLTYFDSNWTPSVYNITTKKWELGRMLVPETDVNKVKVSVYSHQVVIDPSTGIAYIPTGWLEKGSFPMYTYNTSQSHTTNVTKTLVPGVPLGYESYSAVWSTVRNSILFYGGTVGDRNQGKNPPQFAGLMEYQPSTNQWINHTTQGATNPGPIQGACVASAHNGTKMVMFGSEWDQPYSLYILDAKTLVWTKGAEPKTDGRGSNVPRIACTAVGDYLVVTGAYPLDAHQDYVVYNIKLNEWTDSYQPPQTATISTGAENSSTTATASPGAEQGQPSTEGTPSGARIGIIAGASSVLVFLLICGVFLIRRRKMRRPSQADVIDEDLLKADLGRTEKARNNPNYPAYPGEDMNKSTLESSKNPQEQPTIQIEAFREAPSPSPDGHSRIQGARSPQNHSSKAPSPSLGGLLRSQAARNPQHHSSSIPAVAIKQWQCTQQEQNLQYIPTPPSIPIIPALVHYPRRDLQDHHSGYHDRSDSQDDRHHHNQTEDYNATHYDRHADDPQAYYGDHNEDEDYLAIYQDSRMNAPQEHGYSSSENGHSFSNIQRRPDPQDQTRHSAASRLEFYQSRRLNNPQDHGDHGYQVDQDDDALYQEIQRIRAQQEEHIRQRQELECVRLEKEAKLQTLAGRAKYTLPRGQH